jgi:hypothetical protein
VTVQAARETLEGVRSSLAGVESASSAAITAATNAGVAAARAESLVMAALAELEPGVIIGVDGASSWGEGPMKATLAAKIRSERVDLTAPAPLSIAQSIKNGFENQIVIVGNTPDDEPLRATTDTAWVAAALPQLKTAREQTPAGQKVLAIIENEPSLKGVKRNREGEPGVYGRRIVALAKAAGEAGLENIEFIMWLSGDFMLPNGQWSQVNNKGGFTRVALEANPALLTMALAGTLAFNSHPYGKAHLDSGEHTGLGGLEDLIAQLKTLGIPSPQVYVDEYNVPVTGESFTQQAQEVKEGYEELLKIPEVKGVWFYDEEDVDGTRGLFAPNGQPRPVLQVVSQVAQSQAVQ